jgi:hypothetical protein
MKCVSLIQPWATLVILGAKRYEARSWQTDHRGPLAVHASRRFPETARALCRIQPYRSVLEPAGYRHSSDLPTGVVLGTVTLTDCLPTRELLDRLRDDRDQLLHGDYRPGRWAWCLSDPRPLLAPFAYAGRLGLYEVPNLGPELPFALP